METTPSDLPPIDRVNIVILKDINPDGIEYMSHANDAPFVNLQGEAAQLIATLWRQLPPDDPGRCHIPSFGFRFFAAGRIISQASVCWMCNTLMGQTGNHTLSYSFDGAHPIAQQLLSVAIRATGYSPIES